MRLCSIVLLGIGAGAAVSADSAAPEASSGPHRVTSVVRGDKRTGRLVRSVVYSSRRSDKAETRSPSPAVETTVGDLIENTARVHEVDPLLVHSMIRVESGYNQFAVSPKGALGLMQLMPATAQRFGVTNPFDAKQNIEGGVRYLRHLQQLYGDDRLALAAYNAGEGAVSRYGSIPPYSETINYVGKVGRSYGEAKRGGQASDKRVQQGETLEEAIHFNQLEAVMDESGRVYLRTR
jgi:hypothetical protein